MTKTSPSIPSSSTPPPPPSFASLSEANENRKCCLPDLIACLSSVYLRMCNGGRHRAVSTMR